MPGVTSLEAGKLGQKTLPGRFHCSGDEERESQIQIETVYATSPHFPVMCTPKSASRKTKPAKDISRRSKVYKNVSF